MSDYAGRDVTAPHGAAPDGAEHDDVTRGDAAAVHLREDSENLPAAKQPVAAAATDMPLARTAVAAFFDLDKTLLAQSSGLAFARPFYREGLMGRREALRSAYAQLFFSLSGANDKVTEGLRRELSRLVTGWDIDNVRRIIAETLSDVVDPLVHAEALDTIDDHKRQGHAIVIVSASGADVVEPIAQWLQADHWIASELEIDNGRYTGNITFYAHGPAKAEAMAALATTQGWDLSECYAYSDSSTDIPMLEAVGYPHAVNPDADLKQRAIAQGWPVLKWHRSVPLRERLPKIDRKTGTRIALTAVVIAVVWSWVHSRRRRTPLAD